MSWLEGLAIHRNKDKVSYDPPQQLQFQLECQHDLVSYTWEPAFKLERIDAEFWCIFHPPIVSQLSPGRIGNWLKLVRSEGSYRPDTKGLSAAFAALHTVMNTLAPTPSCCCLMNPDSPTSRLASPDPGEVAEANPKPRKVPEARAEVPSSSSKSSKRGHSSMA
jgi:hypothetical protein